MQTRSLTGWHYAGSVGGCRLPTVTATRRNYGDRGGEPVMPARPPARLNGRRTEKPSRRQRPSALRRSVGEETKSERGPFVCLSVCRSVPSSARSAMPSSARVRVGAGRGFETEGEQRGREEGSILKRAFFALALSQDIRGGGCGRHSRRASPSGRAEKGRMQRKGISAWHLSFVFVVSD